VIPGRLQIGRCWSTLTGRVFRATTKKVRTPQIGGTRPKLYSRFHQLHASAELGRVPLNDVSADPAFRWDTPSHPMASRAEPPNSAQPFPYQLSDPMKCLQLYPHSSRRSANPCPLVTARTAGRSLPNKCHYRGKCGPDSRGGRETQEPEHVRVSISALFVDISFLAGSACPRGIRRSIWIGMIHADLDASMHAHRCTGSPTSFASFANKRKEMATRQRCRAVSPVTQPTWRLTDTGTLVTRQTRHEEQIHFAR
jgi:hypothetical protein